MATHEADSYSTKQWKGTVDEAHASKVDQNRVVTGAAKDPAVPATKVSGVNADAKGPSPLSPSVVKTGGV
jgi:hypothetical protein